MTPALELELLDLRHFSAASLRSLLDAEASVWSERLEWDYRASARLLLQYLDSRVLPGYVALESGRVSGYVFCVYEERKAVIGDVFALQPQTPDTTAADIEDRLLSSLIELLKNSPGVERIESQLLLHPHGLHAGVFEAAGFEVHKRLFMRREMAVPTPQPPQPARPRPVLEDLELRAWREDDFNAAAQLISAAYAGHTDSHINDQYRSAAGSLRFLHNIVRFPGCGVFDPQASRVLARRDSRELAGALLCSRVRDDVAHITQICVAKERRRQGLGRLLIEDCAAGLAIKNYRALTLTVTEANTDAVALYLLAGFETRHCFDAMLWEKHRS
jgi:ribosomal protein S18 acetylase RimI-like enzyme